jgi:hypothetical protein
MPRRTLVNGSIVPMEPGERDRAVKIEYMSEERSATKQPIERWYPLASVVWMRKMDVTAEERVKAAQVAAVFDTQWEMGYWSEMDPETVDIQKTRRLVYQDRVYLIVGAALIGRRDGIELLTIAASKVGTT